MVNKGKKVVQEEEVEEIHKTHDISADYGAPFPLYTPMESVNYCFLLQKKLSVCNYFDDEILESLKIKDEIHDLYARLGWTKFVSVPYATYKDLVLEFYTSLTQLDDSNKKFSCRLGGTTHDIDYDTMFRVFGFKKGGVCDPSAMYSAK